MKRMNKEAGLSLLQQQQQQQQQRHNSNSNSSSIPLNRSNLTVDTFESGKTTASSSTSGSAGSGSLQLLLQRRSSSSAAPPEEAACSTSANVSNIIMNMVTTTTTNSSNNSNINNSSNNHPQHPSSSNNNNNNVNGNEPSGGSASTSSAKMSRRLSMEGAGPNWCLPAESPDPLSATARGVVEFVGMLPTATTGGSSRRGSSPPPPPPLLQHQQLVHADATADAVVGAVAGNDNDQLSSMNHSYLPIRRSSLITTTTTTSSSNTNDPPPTTPTTTTITNGGNNSLRRSSINSIINKSLTLPTTNEEDYGTTTTTTTTTHNNNNLNQSITSTTSSFLLDNSSRSNSTASVHHHHHHHQQQQRRNTNSNSSLSASFQATTTTTTTRRRSSFSTPLHPLHATIVFVDLEGYSKSSDVHQRRLTFDFMNTLRNLVTFAYGEMPVRGVIDNYVILPTGDGAAVIVIRPPRRVIRKNDDGGGESSTNIINNSNHSSSSNNNGDECNKSSSNSNLKEFWRRVIGKKEHNNNCNNNESCRNDHCGSGGQQQSQQPPLPNGITCQHCCQKTTTNPPTSLRTTEETALWIGSSLLLWASHRHIGLRVGLNSGELSIVEDPYGDPNVCGDAINMAARIMDTALPGQILASASSVVPELNVLRALDDGLLGLGNDGLGSSLIGAYYEDYTGVNGGDSSNNNNLSNLEEMANKKKQQENCIHCPHIKYEIAENASEVVVKHGVTTSVQSITCSLHELPRPDDLPPELQPDCVVGVGGGVGGGPALPTSSCLSHNHTRTTSSLSQATTTTTTPQDNNDVTTTSLSEQTGGDVVQPLMSYPLNKNIPSKQSFASLSSLQPNASSNSLTKRGSSNRFSLKRGSGSDNSASSSARRNSSWKLGDSWKLGGESLMGGGLKATGGCQSLMARISMLSQLSMEDSTTNGINTSARTLPTSNATNTILEQQQQQQQLHNNNSASSQGTTTHLPKHVGNHRTPATKWYMKIKPTEMQESSTDNQIKPKVLPQELIRRHKRIAFLGIMHDNLSRGFVKILETDPNHRWDQVYILFPSDSCLKLRLRMNYKDQPVEKLMSNKRECRRVLTKLLSQVVSDLRFLEYDQLMHCGSYWDWKDPGGFIHVSPVTWGANPKMCPAMNYYWNSKVPSPEYRVYREGLEYLLGTAKEFDEEFEITGDVVD